MKTRLWCCRKVLFAKVTQLYLLETTNACFCFSSHFVSVDRRVLKCFEYHTMQPPREAYAMVLRKGWMMNLQVQEEKL